MELINPLVRKPLIFSRNYKKKIIIKKGSWKKFPMSGLPMSR